MITEGVNSCYSDPGGFDLLVQFTFPVPASPNLPQAILDVVVNLQFQMVENLWHHFWASDTSKTT